MSSSPRFQRVRLIGSGGMGEVYLAEDLALGRQVAIKVLRNDATATLGQTAIDRMLREARLAASLRHPNIVTVYDIDLSEGPPKLIMEYIDGSQLAQQLRRVGRFSPMDAARIMAPIADGLAAAHRAGIIHRDIKPANVLMGTDGAVKLADFGIALSPNDPHITNTGELIGTPAFMAPESIRSDSTTPASDVWSFGATLYAAVEGRGPFDSESPTSYPAMIFRIMHDPVRPPEHAAALTALLRRMLTMDPEQRPTMDVVAAELRALVASAPAPPVEPGHGPDDPPTRPPGPPEPAAPDTWGALPSGAWGRSTGSDAPPAAPEVPAAAAVGSSVGSPPTTDGSPSAMSTGVRTGVRTSHHPARPPRRRRRWVLVALAAILVLGGAVTAFAMARHGHQRPGATRAGSTPPPPTPTITVGAPGATDAAARKFANPFSPDGKTLWLQTARGVSVVDTATNKLIHKISTSAATAPIRPVVSVRGDYAYAVVSQLPNTACGAALDVIDTSLFRVTRTIPVPHGVCSFAATADGHVAAAGIDGTVAMIDPVTKKVSTAQSPQPDQSPTGVRRRLQMLPDGLHFITSYSGYGRINLWDDALKLTRAIGPTDGTVDQLLSYDGTQVYTLAAATQGSVVTCYSTADGSVTWTRTLSGHPAFLRGTGKYLTVVTLANADGHGASQLTALQVDSGAVESTSSFNSPVSVLRNDTANLDSDIAYVWLNGTAVASSGLTAIDLATGGKHPIAGAVGSPIMLSADGSVLYERTGSGVIVVDVVRASVVATVKFS